MRIGDDSRGTSSTSGSSVEERFQVGVGVEPDDGYSHAVNPRGGVAGDSGMTVSGAGDGLAGRP